MTGSELSKHPVHLGLGASATIQPAFTGDMSWYQDYGTRHAADGYEGRLVSQHTFTACWDMWEMHPNGAEVVLCVEGELTILQEAPDGTVSTVTLKPGEYVINDPGVWHTADVETSATAVFITAGVGTQHRAR